jgi:hypothetical protein
MAANEVRREVPKIMGSSTVFIVLVVVLVFIIIVACSAVIYLIREDRRAGGQEARLRRRYNAQPLIDRDLSNPQHSRKWYSYLWGSRDRHYHTRLDKSASGDRVESWIQANGSRDWDVNDFSEERDLRSTEGNNNHSAGLLGMSEHESSASSPFVEPHAYAHRHTFDGASTPSSSILRYDPHDVRGLPYPDQFPRATNPSIINLSQLNSPTLSSSRSSPVPRPISKSPEPILNNNSTLESDDDDISDGDSPNPQFAAPQVVRTAGSGTKFFESL